MRVAIKDFKVTPQIPPGSENLQTTCCPPLNFDTFHSTIILPTYTYFKILDG